MKTVDEEKLGRGMREDELRALGKCVLCGQGLCNNGMPMFWCVKLQRYGLEVGAVNRQAGLTQFFQGHAALARVMGADEELAKPLMEERVIGVCETCAGSPSSVYQLGLPE